MLWVCLQTVLMESMGMNSTNALPPPSATPVPTPVAVNGNGRKVASPGPRRMQRVLTDFLEPDN